MGVKTYIKRTIKKVKKKEMVPVQHVVESNKVLDGKVAVIIGGSGGIGLSIAREYYESGCKVVLCGTNQEKLDKCISDFHDKENVASMVLDVADIRTMKENVKRVVEIYGHVDILVNSAGVHTENVDFFTVTPEEYDRVMNINIKGPYFVCREFAEYMMKECQNGERKHILLISSTRGFEPAWSPYGISKWALNGLTQGLAQMLLPHGIVVNAIAPGSTATELIGVKDGDSINTEENGIGRLVMPDEVANIAKLLVSPAGDMVVGETIRVSGGRGVFDIR